MSNLRSTKEDCKVLQLTLFRLLQSFKHLLCLLLHYLHLFTLTKKYRNKHTHTHTHTHVFNGPFSGTTRVSQNQKGKTNLDFTEARDSECSGISWAICKSATRSRQITMPAPHHSVFYRPDALPAAQPTASKH